MRRISTTAAVVLGLALVMLPGSGHAADQPSSVRTGDCGAGAGSTTETVLYNGEWLTITTDNFGDCLTPVSNSVTLQSSLPAAGVLPAAGAPPAVPVPGRPAFTG